MRKPRRAVVPGGLAAALALAPVLKLVLVLAAPAAGAAPAPVRVAAAADLAVAFRELGALFRARTGKQIVFSFGSTGLLARQLAEGAPFDLFAAADVAFADAAAASGACDAASKALYARGRIVVWTAPGGAAPPAALRDLADPRFKKIAIANPAHAPYGRAAKQALEAVGVWASVEPRLVYGENVQQTLQFARSGNAEAAVVALSLAGAAPEGRVLPIDPALHLPIDQALVVCRHGADAAGGRAFAALAGSAEGREVLRRHGFLLSGDAQPPAR